MDAQRVIDAIASDVKRQYPGREDISMADIQACDPEVICAFRTGVRVKVRNTRYGDVRTGTVSRTTGWEPALLLIHRSNASGSSDVLTADDKIVARWDGRKYVPATGVFA